MSSKETKFFPKNLSEVQQSDSQYEASCGRHSCVGADTVEKCFLRRLWWGFHVSLKSSPELSWGYRKGWQILSPIDTRWWTLPAFPSDTVYIPVTQDAVFSMLCYPPLPFKSEPHQFSVAIKSSTWVLLRKRSKVLTCRLDILGIPILKSPRRDVYETKVPQSLHNNWPVS